VLSSDRMLFELHAKLSAFQRKVDWSRQIIEEALSKDIQWALSFSGGIDSTVLLDLLSLRDFQGRIQWGDDGFDYPETLQFLAETEQRYGLRVQRARCMQPWRDWCVEMYRPDLCEDPEALEAWGNPCQWDVTYSSLKDAPDIGGVFLGMLACESRHRMYVLGNGHRTLYQVKNERQRWHCSPLATWSKRDIWSYVISRNLSYNPIYDQLAALGIPLERRRVAPLTCFQTVQYGSHAVLRQGWPALYQRLVTAFPVIASYS
jgi:phosphoadenosine phosphosulfate reductase